MLFNWTYFKEVYFALSLLILIILIGTVGFIIIEDYNVFEAFYMTIITVSTVGFGEVRTLSDPGRVFTAFLIITSFGTFALAVTSITKYLVGGEFKDYFRDYKVNKLIEKMDGHVIVCGFGRNGKQATKTLQAHGKPFLVIERNEEYVDELKRESDIPYVIGDATLEENVIRAGIKTASAIITTLPSDSDNLYVVLTARQLNANLTIISRASQDNSDKKLRMAGADNVIMPDKVGGAHMASLVVTPDVMDFLDHISVQGEAAINLEEVLFTHLPQDAQYKTIRELESKYKTGALIVGFKTPQGEYIINPSPDLELVPGVKLFVLGTNEQIQRLNQIFGIDAPH